MAAETPPGSLLLSQLMKGTAMSTSTTIDEADVRDIVVYGTSLKVSNPSLGAACCSRVLQTVRSNPMLTDIDLTGCNIDRGDELAEIVQTAQYLKRLVLEWNNLGLARTGISSLTSAIGLSPALKEVDLRSNRIGPSFAAAFANALRSSRSLSFIDLRWNSIGPTGAGAFVTLLQRNPLITSVQLAGNGIPQKLLSQIDKLVEVNRNKVLVPHSRPHIKHPIEECASKMVNREAMDAMYSGRMIALEEEIKNLGSQVENLKKEKDDIRLEELAAQSQLKVVRLELTEEALLRKYIDKEASDLKGQLLSIKQELASCQERMKNDAAAANATIESLKAAFAESQRNQNVFQELYEAAVNECKSLKEEILYIKSEQSAKLKSTEDSARADAEQYSTTITKLQAEVSIASETMAEEVSKVRAQLAAEVRAAEAQKEAAQSAYEQEIEKLKLAASTAESQFAMRESLLRQEKESMEKLLNGRVTGVKSDVEMLQAELDSIRKEFNKAKTKHAAEIEEYVTSIAQQKVLQHRVELSKSDLEEKIFSLTAEKVRLQEKLKLAEDKEKVYEKKMELEKLKCLEQASTETARHVEEKRRLENELVATRKLVENTQKHLHELQTEQERRKLDVEKRVIGVETTFIEWIRTQFAGLRAANSTHPFLVGEF